MLTAIWAIIIFLMVVMIHELGHFTVAKLVGIKVNEFSIGMGPKLIQKKKGETQYTLRALPIGGYVLMEGEDEESEAPNSFGKASPLARFLVMGAGAFMNFVLAIVVFTIVAFSVGTPTTEVETVQAGTPAEVAGIVEGDKIIEIDGTSIKSWDEVLKLIGASEGSLEMKVEKSNGSVEVLDLEPIEMDGRKVVGIGTKMEKNVGSSFVAGLKMTKDMIFAMVNFFKQLFRGELSAGSVSGPVGVVREIGNAAKMGVYQVLMLMGLISVNLGFFNLLPIPALDGSKMLLLIIEGIRGKGMDPNKEGMIHFIGFAALMVLMLVITFKDIFTIFVK